VAVTYHGSSLSINYTSVAVVFHTTVTCARVGAIKNRIRYIIIYPFISIIREAFIAFHAADLFPIPHHLIVTSNEGMECRRGECRRGGWFLTPHGWKF